MCHIRHNNRCPKQVAQDGDMILPGAVKGCGAPLIKRRMRLQLAKRDYSQPAYLLPRTLQSSQATVRHSKTIPADALGHSRDANPLGITTL